MTKRKHFIASLLFLFTIGFSAQLGAQYRGVVLDATDNSPLPGAVIKAGQESAMTDIEGRWTLDVAQGSTARVSFVGYLSQNIEFGASKEITVKLKYDQAGATLDEVVVVGFGTQKKSNVTGAISSVKSEDLEDLQLPRVETALQGRTSGVSVVQSSGQPGAGATIRIRGTSSINGSDPLYVIDGVVIGGGIDFLNPNDIETIEVLKDAASAAIYGARGANGVIIITTKNGSKVKGMQVKVTLTRDCKTLGRKLQCSMQQNTPPCKMKWPQRQVRRFLTQTHLNMALGQIGKMQCSIETRSFRIVI